MNEPEEPEALLRKMAGLDPTSPSETTGDADCFFCGAWVSLGDEHRPDCLWLRAKAIAETSKQPDPIAAFAAGLKAHLRSHPAWPDRIDLDAEIDAFAAEFQKR